MALIDFDLSKLPTRAIASSAIFAGGSYASTFIVPATVATVSAAALSSLFSNILAGDIHEVLKNRKPKPKELLQNHDIRKVIKETIADLIVLSCPKKLRKERSCLQELANHLKRDWDAIIDAPSYRADFESVAERNLLRIFKAYTRKPNLTVLTEELWFKLLEDVAEVRQVKCIARYPESLKRAAQTIHIKFSSMVREQIKHDYEKGGSKAFAGIWLQFVGESLDSIDRVLASSSRIEKRQTQLYRRLTSAAQDFSSLANDLVNAIDRKQKRRYSILFSRLQRSNVAFNNRLDKIDAAIFSNSEMLGKLVVTSSRLNESIAASHKKLAGIRFRLGRIPRPSIGAPFVGRSAIIKRLESVRRAKNKHIAYLYGFGGIGKSTIVWHWLTAVQKNGFPGFDNAFDWSFYGQGQGQSGTGSLPFFDALIDHLSSLGFEQLRKTPPNSRGEAVARCFMESGGLLVLDGLETLQHPPDVKDGECRDKEINDFIDILCRESDQGQSSNWMVVLTSRWQIPHKDYTSFETIHVGQLSLRDSGKLLQEFEVKEPSGGVKRLHFNPPRKTTSSSLPFARKLAFEKVAKPYNGEPLALCLLASYLIENHGGKLELGLTKAKLTSKVRKDKATRHAERIVNQFVQMFEEGEKKGERKELMKFSKRALYLISLFDRPLTDVDVELVIEGNPIRALTTKMDFPTFDQAVSYLQQIQLVTLTAEGVDSHPLVRERMGEIFRKKHRSAWKIAQSRIFTGLLEGDSVSPESLSRCIYHGCRGEKSRKCHDLYMDKFVGDQPGLDSWKAVASRGDDLAVLSNFYTEKWTEMVPDLRPAEKGELLNETGYDLQKLCRHLESVNAFRTSVRIWISEKNWRKAARDSVLLGKSYLALGKIAFAVSQAKKALDFARKSENEKQVLNALALLGEAEHFRGNGEKSATYFKQLCELEDRIKKEEQNDEIYAVRVVQFAGFLIDNFDETTAIGRLERAMSICLESPEKFQVDIAFNELFLAKAHLTQCEYGELTSARIAQAERHLISADRGNWKLDLLDCRAYTYLEFARLYRLKQVMSRAQLYLEKASKICRDNELHRLSVDCNLELAMQVFKKNEKEKAKRLLRNVIDQCKNLKYFRLRQQLYQFGVQLGVDDTVARELKING